jgi:hypothetical protein
VLLVLCCVAAPLLLLLVLCCVAAPLLLLLDSCCQQCWGEPEPEQLVVAEQELRQ